MALPVAGQVGPQALSDGTQLAVLRQDRSSALVVSEAHGRYYETAFRKALFSGATGAVTTTAALATTYTGLVLTNPIGSPVNLVLQKIGMAAIVAQSAALLLGVMTGFNPATAVTQTTPITPGSNFVGGGPGYGLLASSATLPTAPTLRKLLGGLVTGAITVQMQTGQEWDVEGSIIVPPGGYAAFYTSAASVASSLAFSMTWEEVSTNG